MKRRNIVILLTLLMSMMGISATAHDIEVKNSNDVTIYYIWTNNRTELSVSYRGSSYNTYSNEYTGTVVIPASVTYNGTAYPVTSIGYSAFYGCYGLTSVTIPNSVTSIGNYAFYGCSGLTSVTIPNSVTSIGYSAFRGCSGLTSVTIPNSVTAIGSDAFRGCSGLTSVTIPNSVTSIGYSAFYGCSGLTSVNIPNSVTSIGSQAFSGTTWYNNQPDGLVYAGKVAYKYKGKMPSNTSIILEEGTLGIATDAFSDCIGLTSVTIPNSVTSIGNDAFYGCSGLTSVTIPNSVTSIGNYAFSGCSGLTSVTIPNSVTRIGGVAFERCSGLTSVTIPNSVTSIGGAAFSYCSGLTSITVESGNTVYDSRNNCNAIITTKTNELIAGCKNTTIPNSVTSIGNYAFSGCSGLTSVTIPNSVTRIGGVAFERCSGLTSVNIPNSVTAIGDCAFYGCSGLTSVTIPNSVTAIGNEAFSYCSHLTSIIVESGNTVYDSRNNCNAIITTETNELIAGFENTTIPNSVTSIGNYAFWGCGLTSVTIPNSVTAIGEYAFAYCSGLTSVTIPNSVTAIGNYAFIYCSSLTSVKAMMETPVGIDSYTFSNRTNATLYVPYGCKAAYQAADYWKEFKEIKEWGDETDISQLDNAIYIEPTEVISGNQAVLSVKMKNNVAIQTIQFDLYLPEGVTVVPNEDQELITASKARINKFNYFNSTMQENGALRLLAQATTTNVPAGDGEICRVTVNVPESMDEGDYPIIFKDVLMVEANNTSHSPDPNVVQCKLTVLPYTPGDANNDGEINAIDFNMIGNYILGNHSQANFSFRAADFNNDGYVNAIDFNMVGNYILYGSSAPSRAARGKETLDPQ